MAGFVLRPWNFLVVYADKEIQLTGTEFRILHAFVCADGKRISREEIVRLVWGSANMSPNLFDTHLMNLRKKIPELNTHLRAVRGKGYIFISKKEA